MKRIMGTSYEDICKFMIMYYYIFLVWEMFRHKV